MRPVGRGGRTLRHMAGKRADTLRHESGPAAKRMVADDRNLASTSSTCFRRFSAYSSRFNCCRTASICFGLVRVAGDNFDQVEPSRGFDRIADDPQLQGEQETFDRRIEDALFRKVEFPAIGLGFFIERIALRQFAKFEPRLT